MEPEVTVPDAPIEYAAILDAVAIFRQPMLARKMTASALPEGMIVVLRIAAEGDEPARLLANQIAATPKELHEACLFYLRTVVFHQHASDTRLLALLEPVTMTELRNHKRMIFKWLHPDRNHNSWETKLFLRIKAASLRLEQVAKFQTPIPIASVQPTKIIHNPRGRKSINHIRRLPIPSFWKNLFLNNAVPLFLAIIMLVVVGWAIITMTTGYYDFGYAYEVAN